MKATTRSPAPPMIPNIVKIKTIPLIKLDALPNTSFGTIKVIMVLILIFTNAEPIPQQI
jgi:hypothetical protein